MKKLLLMLLCVSLCQATNATKSACAHKSCPFGKRGERVFCCKTTCPKDEHTAKASYDCRQIYKK